MIIEETELFDKEILIGGDLGYANKARTKAITINDYGDGYRIRQYVSNGNMNWQRTENIPMQLPVKPANAVMEIIDNAIQENKRYYDEKSVCWVCYEDDYCPHAARIDALEDIKKRLSV